MGADNAAHGFHGVFPLDNVGSPGNVRVYCFANDVGRLRETEFKRRGGAYRSLGVVRRNCNPMRFGQRRDPPGSTDAAAMGEIHLANLAAALLEQILKGRQVGDPFAGGDGGRDRSIDHRQSLDVFRPTRFFKKVETVRIKSFAELKSHRRRRSCVAVDHDVDLLPDRVSHGGNRRLSESNRLQAFDGCCAGNSHAFEGREALVHGLLSEFTEVFGVFY